MAKRKEIKLEYLVKSSPTILFEFLSEPAELGQWFADKVTEEKEVYTFIWEGYPQLANLGKYTQNEVVRFDWQENDEFLQFEIIISDITKETILMVTDFCDEKGENDMKMLWDTSIKKLNARIGGH